MSPSNTFAPPDCVTASVRDALTRMNTSLTLAEVKGELRRHLLDRWKAREARTRFDPTSAPVRRPLSSVAR